MRVIPAASSPRWLIFKLRAVRKSCESVRSLLTPDVMIVDTGAGIDQTVQTFVAAYQVPVLVVCDEPASLQIVMR